MVDRRTNSKGFQEARYRRLIGMLVDQRKRLNWSQENLAHRLGRHQQFVSRFELGERRLDVVEFVDIARTLGMNATTLIEAID